MIIFINNNYLKINNNFELNIFKNNEAICISINDKINKLKNFFKKNISIVFLCEKNEKIINILRHSCSHLMANSIKNLYKYTKFAIGPVIKNGFYYDLYSIKSITKNDIITIEKEMYIISKKNIDIIKYTIKYKNAIKFFKKNKYKTDIINNISNKEITIYKQKNFVDLCSGPHIKNTKNIKHFKILKISGAYWKNNKKNNMLYRIYGTAWNSKNQLNVFLKKQKQLKELDHKKIGLALNLFCFDNYSSGVVFWNKAGWQIYQNIIKYIKKYTFKDFYEVNTPQLINEYLFNKSGHIQKYKENMFIIKNETNKDILKPMNCPCHVNIFNNKTKSYKDLPYRISEFGSCFRNEISGSLYGLMRLKVFTQDDGHIFCNEKQIYQEIKNFIIDLKNVYFNFGFKIFKATIAKKPNQIKKISKIWTKAEFILEKAIKKMKIKYDTSNDGAFYGPKLEIMLKDTIGRYWQCGTIQIDFFSAKRLNAFYTEKNGKIKSPIMLHRAITGSIERFFGILIENNDGFIPFWININQFEIIYINDKYLKYAKKIYNIIIKSKYNVKLTLLNENLNYKIKKSILDKINFIIVIGEKEIKNKFLCIRSLKTNKYVKITLNKFIRFIKFKKEVYY